MKDILTDFHGLRNVCMKRDKVHAWRYFIKNDASAAYLLKRFYEKKPTDYKFNA
ncbi:hypothetical protein KUL106_07520 [Alteromonas sp. KUL106]|nr:hypothetical protein KUL106_07520 [Alteromonas sp. KUL106]